MSQLQQIRKRLLTKGSITAIEALNEFGCFRLSARIFDLKDEGLDIKTQIVYNGKKSYARYVL